MNAERPSQGACKLAFPCATISPSDGDPGGKPKPKKSNDVNVAIEPERIKGISVNVATIAFGSTCLNINLYFLLQVL